MTKTEVPTEVEFQEDKPLLRQSPQMPSHCQDREDKGIWNLSSIYKEGGKRKKVSPRAGKHLCNLRERRPCVYRLPCARSMLCFPRRRSQGSRSDAGINLCHFQQTPMPLVPFIPPPHFVSLWGHCAAGKKVGCERMVTSQVSGESLGRPPSVGSWLHAGKNSRASQSKEGLLREIHSAECEPSHKAKGVSLGVVSFCRGG